MLSPMAGVTNLPFRSLCASFAKKGANLHGDLPTGIFMNEMLSARALAGHINKVKAKLTYAQNEPMRSCQLYVLDPEYSYLAAKQIVENDLADHIDLNFGCPVKKVTKNGGGSVIPSNPKLLREIVRSVKSGIDEGLKINTKKNNFELSAKFRLGIDEDEIFYLRTAQICVEEGCSLLTLHARTTAQFYSGDAAWKHIKLLKDNAPKNILIFGNGDIWSANDAKNMLDETGADGVCIGRGAVGRPWLFYDLANLFTSNSYLQYTPDLSEVVEIMLDHLDSTTNWIKRQNELSKPISSQKNTFTDYEQIAIRSFRAHIPGYIKGFNLNGLKSEIMSANSKEALVKVLSKLDLTQHYPVEVGNLPRGRRKAAKKVFMPQGW